MKRLRIRERTSLYRLIEKLGYYQCFKCGRFIKHHGRRHPFPGLKAGPWGWGTFFHDKCYERVMDQIQQDKIALDKKQHLAFWSEVRKVMIWDKEMGIQGELHFLKNGERK